MEWNGILRIGDEKLGILIAYIVMRVMVLNDVS